MDILYRVLGGFLLFFGIWGIVYSYKMKDKVHMKLYKRQLDSYQVIKKKEYIKAQNTTLLLLDAFLINIGILGLYGYPTFILAVALPLFNIGFSYYAKKYVKMKN